MPWTPKRRGRGALHCTWVTQLDDTFPQSAGGTARCQAACARGCGDLAPRRAHRACCPGHRENLGWATPFCPGHGSASWDKAESEFGCVALSLGGRSPERPRLGQWAHVVRRDPARDATPCASPRRSLARAARAGRGRWGTGPLGWRIQHLLGRQTFPATARSRRLAVLPTPPRPAEVLALLRPSADHPLGALPVPAPAPGAAGRPDLGSLDLQPLGTCSCSPGPSGSRSLPPRSLRHCWPQPVPHPAAKTSQRKVFSSFTTSPRLELAGGGKEYPFRLHPCPPPYLPSRVQTFRVGAGGSGAPETRLRGGWGSFLSPPRSEPPRFPPPPPPLAFG